MPLARLVDVGGEGQQVVDLERFRLAFDAGGNVDGVADDGVGPAAFGAEQADRGDTAVDADAEGRPVGVCRLHGRGGLLQRQSRRGSPGGVVGLVAALVEGDHQRVADDPVHVPAMPSYHWRYDDLEVRVEHRSDLGRVVVLGEAGETLQVGEQHAQLPAPRHRVLQIEV